MFRFVKCCVVFEWWLISTVKDSCWSSSWRQSPRRPRQRDWSGSRQRWASQSRRRTLGSQTSGRTCQWLCLRIWTEIMLKYSFSSKILKISLSLSSSFLHCQCTVESLDDDELLPNQVDGVLSARSHLAMKRPRIWCHHIMMTKLDQQFYVGGASKTPNQSVSTMSRKC